MNFSRVPLNIHPYIEKLTEDQVFQQRFSNDEVLNQLDQLKYDPFIQYNQFQLCSHNKFKIPYVQKTKHGFWYKIVHKLFPKFFKQHSPYTQLEPITLGLWSFLYIIKSPIIFKQKPLTKIDVDLFFYLLQTKNYNASLNTLMMNSFDYCGSVLHLQINQINQVLQKMIKISFRVLNMFPKYNLDGVKPVFNVDWLTSIATKVCQVSNYNIQDVYHKISVSEAYYLFAQYCREKGSEAIYLRTEQEIMQEEDLRATTLVVERLIELKVVEQKDKQFYIKIIHEDQEKE